MMKFLSRILLCLAALMATTHSGAMVELADEQLSEITGQALFMMDNEAGSGAWSNLDFYKVGLDAVLEINTNIEKLQLGCGGVNGPGCDIDIDHLSLSGNCENNRVNCSALLTRPFVEFAIKNDHDAALREVVGFRLSSEFAQGMLTAGQNTSEPNGINTFSGYMTSLPVYGTAQTQAVNLGGSSDPNSTVLQFDTDPDIALCTSGCYSGNTGTSDPNSSAGVNIPSLSVPFNGAGAVINGSRQTSTNVTATGAVPTVSLTGGQLDVSMESTIRVLFLISVSEATVNLEGSVSGLSTEIDFTQDLGFIHKVKIDSPFYLSFQSESVKWPGSASADVAQQGWWMSFADPVDLGELNPVEQIDISPTFNQMATAFRQYFEANPIGIDTGQGLQQLFNGEMDVNVGSLTIPSTLYMSVSDLQLGTEQNVPPNCWGSATFC